MKPSKLRPNDILDQLDKIAADDNGVFFPNFDNGVAYHVDQRLTAYGDGSRWIVIIEQLEVNPRSWGLGVHTELYFHGNAITLKPQPGWEKRPIKSVTVFENGPGGPLLDSESGQVNLAARDVLIRGKAVPIRTNLKYYSSHKIEVPVVTNQSIDQLIAMYKSWMDRPNVSKAEMQLKIEKCELRRADLGKPELELWHLVRGMVPEHRDVLLANEEERREGIPSDLPRLLQIDEWDHPKLFDLKRPSECRSFKMIAEVLAAQNPKLYTPVKNPNTHWSNWPDSGSL